MGPAIQIGGVASGTFSNGILIDGLAATTAAGIAPVGSAAMDSLLNTGSGVYNTGAVIFSNTHKLLFRGTAASPAYIYNDSSDFLHIVSSTTGIAFQDPTDTSTNVFIAAGGLVTLGATSTINWNAAQTGTSVGAAGGASALPATPTGYISIQVAGVARRVPFYA
jgi:hypothetical protein